MPAAHIVSATRNPNHAGAPRVESSFWLSLGGVGLAVSWPEVDGVPTRVLEAGRSASRKIVMLHGTGGHLEAFVHNIAALAATAHVIAYDLPGHGWSGAPPRSYEIDGYVRHLGALLDVMGIEEAVLVGQSLGGWIATRYAHQRPERVRGLLLIGPGGTVSDPAVMEQLRRSSLDAVTAPNAESVRRRLELVIADRTQVTDELVRCRLQIYSQRGAPERMRRLLCLQEPAIRERNLLTSSTLAAVMQPALVLCGEHDRVTSVSTCRKFAELLPAGRLAIMPGCGHWPQFEMPREFNAVAEAFVAGEGYAADTPLVRSQSARK